MSNESQTPTPPTQPTFPGREIFSTHHLNDDLKGRSMRSGAIIIGAQIIRNLLNVISIAVLAKWVAPDQQGLVFTVTAITGFILMFKDMGLTTATVQQPIVTHEQISTLFWFNVALGIGLMLITFALAPFVVDFYDNEQRLFGIMMVLGATFILSGLSVQHHALLRRTMQFKKLATINILAKVVGTITAIVMAITGCGYWSLVGAAVAVRISSTLFSWYYCRWMPGKPVRNSGAWNMIKFGTNVTTANICDYWAGHIDNILIAKFWGIAQVGYYTRAYSLLLLPVQMAAGPIGAVAIAALSRVADQPNRYRNAFVMLYKKMTMLFLPAVTALATLAPWVIGLILGPDWTPSIAIFQALTAAALYQPIMTTANWLFITQNRTKEMLKVRIINSILAIISIVVALPFGPVFVALSYSLSGLFIRIPIEIYMVGKTGPVSAKQYTQGLIPPIVAALAVFAVCSATLHLLPQLTNLQQSFPQFNQELIQSIVGLSIALPLAILATLAIYFAIPESRAELLSTRSMFSTLKNKTKPKDAQDAQEAIKNIEHDPKDT